VNFSQADDIIPGIGTQGVEGLSQTSYVPGFDPSQTNKGDSKDFSPRFNSSTAVTLGEME